MENNLEIKLIQASPYYDYVPDPWEADLCQCVSDPCRTLREAVEANS